MLVTFWGPLQGGTVSQPLGRIACLDEPAASDLVWTRDDSQVLTKAVGYTPKILFKYFQQYSGAVVQPPGSAPVSS